MWLMALAASVAYAVACLGQGEPGSEPTFTPTSVATEAPSPSPEPTLTPATNADLAAALRAAAYVEARDEVGLRALAAGNLQPCERTVSGVGGGPVCGADELEGTLVAAIGSGGCDGASVRSEDLTLLPEDPAVTIYAVFRPRSDTVVSYQVLLSNAQYYMIYRGGVRGLFLACAASAAEWAAARAAEFLIPPPHLRPMPTPVRAMTAPAPAPRGDLATALTVAALIVERNETALRALLRPTLRPCGLPPDAGAHPVNPPCGPGEVPGTGVLTIGQGGCNLVPTRLERARVLPPDGSALYGIARPWAEEGASYVVLLSNAWRYPIRDGGIIDLPSGCVRREDWLHRAFEFLIPPLLPDPLANEALTD